MITQKELKDISIQLGIPLPHVEKDYVMGWLLWGIYRHQDTAGNLILKGGNSLRKVYFTDTRFSDDLDFTARRLDRESDMKGQLVEICKLVTDASGIEFNTTRTIVDQKITPDRDCTALDGRVYFDGIAGDSSVSMRIKFDISDYEKIIYPVQYHPIIHNYSDVELCSTNIQTYSIEEILAEKLRSWIQRTRSRDLFDVVKIIQSNVIPLSKRNILSAFFQKTIFKQVPLAGKDELLFEEKFNVAEKDWMSTIICPKSSLVVARNAINLFKDFVTALFDPSILSSIGASAVSKIYQYNYKSGYRESIVNAGLSRQIIRLMYHDLPRDVEPYSLRYKGGRELFYGFDRTKDQTIKSFFLSDIQGISILPQTFIPRWSVEF